MLYNPLETPPVRWLESPEILRLEAVRRYHLQTRCLAPEERFHASLHVIVENQLAEGYAPTVAGFARLRDEGLDRHEAIHAVGDVVAAHMHGLLNRKFKGDHETILASQLDLVSAERWRSLSPSVGPPPTIKLPKEFAGLAPAVSSAVRFLEVNARGPAWCQDAWEVLDELRQNYSEDFDVACDDEFGGSLVDALFAPAAYCFAYSGFRERAEDLISFVDKVDPDLFFHERADRGLILAINGNRTDAAACFEAALKRRGNALELIKAGLGYSLLEELETAEEVLREAYEVSGEVVRSEEVAGYLEDVLLRAGKPSELDELLDTGDMFDDSGVDSLSSDTPARAEPKVGRNDPCPCGSGKKSKKCCLG